MLGRGLGIQTTSAFTPLRQCQTPVPTETQCAPDSLGARVMMIDKTVQGCENLATFLAK